MIIDRVLPTFHFNEFHSIRIRATPERIYSTIRHGDFASHPVVRLLLRVRGLGRKAPQRVSLERFLQQGFHLLADDPPRELVLGIEGPFWQPHCKLREVSEATFREPVPGGVARAAWNFAIGADGTLSTETRVLCAPDARRRFAMYWFFVRPFSGLIRRFMLRAIRDSCTQKT